MEGNELVPIVAAVLGGGGFAGVVSVLLSRKKIDAESRALEIKGELEIVNVASELVVTLREELARQSQKIDRLDQKITALEKENDSLEQRVSDLYTENIKLEKRCEELERENKELKRRLK